MIFMVIYFEELHIIYNTQLMPIMVANWGVFTICDIISLNPHNSSVRLLMQVKKRKTTETQVCSVMNQKVSKIVNDRGSKRSMINWILSL